MTDDAFGPHLTLDLIGCPKEILQDYNLHFKLLKDLQQLESLARRTKLHADKSLLI